MSEASHRQEARFEPVNQTSPGLLLKRERERQGLALEDAAVQLNLRPAVVDGLENDHYEEVPISAYRRGYLRAYARLLGVDERTVVDAYNAQHGRSDTERKVTPVDTAPPPPSRVGPWIFKLVTLLVIVGLVVLTLLWWQSRDGNAVLDGLGNEEATQQEGEQRVTPSGGDELESPDAQADNENAAALPPVPEDDSDVGLVDETATDSAGESDSIEPDEVTAAIEEQRITVDELTESASDDAAATATGGNTQGAAAPAAAPKNQQLAFKFNEQSWTEVHDANDERILVGLQDAGSEATVEGVPPFRITIGNADDVELRYEGNIVDLGARAGGTNVARFTLGE